jgi:hypothetical protein
MLIITSQIAVDTDNVERVKELPAGRSGYGSPPFDVLPRCVRVYFADGSSCEYPDPQGALYQAFEKAGTFAS